MKLIFIFLFCSIIVFGQDNSVLGIPEDLKKNANAVLREGIENITINSVDNMVIERSTFYTILSKEGDHFSNIFIPYDKSSRVSDIKVTVYNLLGKEIKTYTKKDFSDYSHTPSFGLYVDDRVLVLKVNSTVYPYSVRTSYTTNSSNTVFIQDFAPPRYYNVAVQNYKRIINNKSGINLRTKITNSGLAKVHATESSTISNYHFADIAAIDEEKFAPSLETFMPKVEFSLEKFNLEGKRGELTTWDSFGKWYYDNLLVPSTTITPELRAEVASLNLTGSTEDKVRTIYQHMQNKTRYVFAAIGIGGWQPMTAEEVRKKGYGDCKALTNYMRAMLDAAGIPSYYSVITSDLSPEKFDENFPKMAGNHVILMVPVENKTIWLENTSQQIAFDHLSYTTTNRNVLAVTSKGIDLVNTPVYPAEKSTEKINAHIKLEEDNSVKVLSDLRFAGSQYDFNMEYIGLSAKELTEKLRERYYGIKFSTIDVQNFRNDKNSAEISYQLNFNANDYSKKLGNDIFFKVIPFSDVNLNTAETSRKLPFENPFAYQDIYELTYEAPQGYQFKDLPSPVEVTSEFGNYQISYQLKDGKLVVNRTLTINKGVYPKEKYASYMDFRKKTIQNDNTKILVTKI